MLSAKGFCFCRVSDSLNLSVSFKARLEYYKHFHRVSDD